EPGYGDVGIWGMVYANAQCRITRCAKINVKFPPVDLCQSHAAGGGAIDRDEKLIPGRRRRRTRAKTSWHQTVGVAQASRRDVESNRISSATRKHRGAVESKNAHAFESKRRPVKQVDREVIGVLGRAPAAVPKRELWVIADPRRVGRIMLDRVKKPTATDRVAGLGNSNALIEWSCAGKRSGECEITDYPAVSDVIVEDKPVAIVEARTGCAN